MTLVMRAAGSVMEVVVLVAPLLACGGESNNPDAGTTDDASGADALSCVKHWTTLQPAGTDVSIANGELHLVADTLPPGCAELMPGDRNRDPGCAGPVRVTRQALVGDFEVALTMTGLALGGDGAFVQVFAVSTEDPTKYMLYTHGSLAEDFMPIPNETVFAGTQETCFQAVGGSYNWPETPVETSASLSLSRAGTTYGYNNGMIFNIDLFRPDEDLIVGVLLGSSSEVEIAQPTSATFSEFTVTGGGGGIAPDSFDCDSLLP